MISVAAIKHNRKQNKDRRDDKSSNSDSSSENEKETSSNDKVKCKHQKVYCHFLRGKVGDPKFIKIKIYPTDKVR